MCWTTGNQSTHRKCPCTCVSVVGGLYGHGKVWTAKFDMATQPFLKRDTTCSAVVKQVKKGLNELMAEISFKRLARAIGKVYRMKFY